MLLCQVEPVTPHALDLLSPEESCDPVLYAVNVLVCPRLDGGCPTALEAHCGCSLNPEGEPGRERQVSYRSGPLHCFVDAENIC